MSPRPYKLGQRQVATDQTRSRIVAAARELLAGETGPAGFTVDAVARQAGVARMTVYYQFQSKRGLLEALFDELANRGLMPHLRLVFHEPDPAKALDGLIAAFAAFWDCDRLVLRRARALAALDEEIGESIRGRDEMRRGHLRKIVERLMGQPPEANDVPAAGPPPSTSTSRSLSASPSQAHAPATSPALAAAVDVLHMLTSFETFDALLGAGRERDDVTRIVRQLAATVLEPPRERPLARSPAPRARR